MRLISRDSEERNQRDLEERSAQADKWYRLAFDLQADNGRLREQNRALGDRVQWLILQLGLLGYDVVTTPAKPPRTITRNIPAVPEHIEVRKARK